MTSIADLLNEEITDNILIDEGKEADFILDLSNSIASRINILEKYFIENEKGAIEILRQLNSMWFMCGIKAIENFFVALCESKNISSLLKLSVAKSLGEGVGDNISSIINNAPDNSIIKIEEGTHTLDSPLDVTNKNITIYGTNRDTCIISGQNINMDILASSDTTGTFKCINVTFQNGKYFYPRHSIQQYNCVNFKNLGWTGESATTESQQGYADLWASSSTSNGGTRFRNAGIRSYAMHCYWYQNVRNCRWQDSTGVQIKSCYVNDSLDPGYYLSSGTYDGLNGCENCTVQDCIARNVRSNPHLIIGGKNNTFLNCKSFNCWNAGIQSYSSCGTIIKSCLYFRCNLESHNGIGNTGDAAGCISWTDSQNVDDSSSQYAGSLTNCIIIEPGPGNGDDPCYIKYNNNLTNYTKNFLETNNKVDKAGLVIDEISDSGTVSVLDDFGNEFYELLSSKRYISDLFRGLNISTTGASDNPLWHILYYLL